MITYAVTVAKQAEADLRAMYAYMKVATLVTAPLFV